MHDDVFPSKPILWHACAAGERGDNGSRRRAPRTGRPQGRGV